MNALGSILSNGKKKKKHTYEYDYLCFSLRISQTWKTVTMKKEKEKRRNHSRGMIMTYCIKLRKVIFWRRRAGMNPDPAVRESAQSRVLSICHC